MDVCVATSCMEDIRCLDLLLRSLDAFADLTSCDLFVSHSSPSAYLRRLVEAVCRSRPAASLTLDMFTPSSTVDSNQHGEALNRLFARTTSKYVMVSDADVVVTSPDWACYCRDRIDRGDFMVGTQYRRPKVMWQGSFPNVWCAMLDGEKLRSARLDMRTEHIRRAKARWVLAPDLHGMHRDTGWRLAEHARESGFGYTTLPETKAGLSSLMQGQGPTGKAGRRRLAMADRRLRHLRSMLFAFPGTDDVCCAHMVRASGRPDRVNRWKMCADTMLDAKLGLIR